MELEGSVWGQVHLVCQNLNEIICDRWLSTLDRKLIIQSNWSIKKCLTWIRFLIIAILYILSVNYQLRCVDTSTYFFTMSSEAEIQIYAPQPKQPFLHKPNIFLVCKFSLLKNRLTMTAGDSKCHQICEGGPGNQNLFSHTSNSEDSKIININFKYNLSNRSGCW